MPDPCVSSFVWNDAAVTLRAPGARLAAEISRFLALPSTAMPDPDAAADVEVTFDRRIVWREGAEVCECATDDDLVMATVAIVSLCMLERTRSIVLHAGAFVVDGHALLFAGSELVGKSSLALAAWRRGFPLMSDDWVAVEPDHAHVVSFPKPLKIRGDLASPEVRREQDNLQPHVLCGRLMSGEQRCMYGRGLTGMVNYYTPVPAGALFLLGRSGDTQTRIALADRDAALKVVLDQTMITRASGLGGVKVLQRLLAAGNVFTCHVGEGDVDGAVTGMVSRFRQRGGSR